MGFSYQWKHNEANFGKPISTPVSGGMHITFEIVLKKDNTYIALQRKGIPDHPLKEGLYFCHGLIRYGESVEDCIKRLVQEQAGVGVAGFKVVDIDSVVQEKDNQWAFTPHVLAEITKIPSISEDVTEVVIFDKSEIPDGFVWWKKAKKRKKKISGIKETIDRYTKQLEKLQKEEKTFLEKEEKKETKVKTKKWYHKLRWFKTSDDFFVIGGRDATSNEIVIKKHTDPKDLVFHTDMAGSPFFILKTEGKKPSEQAIQEVADATITFSKAWKLGLITTDVFYVNPDQVSKKAKAGEYVPKGAFMIYGKTNYTRNKVNLAIGMTKTNEIMAGPVEAIKTHCEKFVEIIQGREKPSTIAKFIQKKVGGDLDDLIRALPGGTCKIKK